MRRRDALVLALAASLPAAARAGERPFVEHRLALQLSDATAEKQALVLSVAAAVLKAYGPDRVALEVVAFGPGIALLRTDNPHRTLVESLMAQEVVFDACLNTVETIERESGAPFPLHPGARRVAWGVPHLLSLAEQGFTLVRP
ncbi:DsrE family protein [Roseicella aquatilis]|uniref:DsrE family protein n=1 Tax=Roseicella aquatilis TaxID=2527868 RepID=A0A4R4D2W1_9PROT|nr:hypothetical protein [Roseicella aquatilis]TCZ52763.1 hypothetical protein EXY23_25905 [Roseicella aquatilis]